MSESTKRLRHLAAFIALSLTLAGCDVVVPPSVRSAGSSLPQRVFLTSGLPKGDRPSELQAEFTRELATALQRRRVSVQPGSPFEMTVAVALAPAEMGITQSIGATGQSVSWSETPHKKGMLDGCRPQRLRVIVLGLAAADGPQKLAEGDVSACRITQIQSAALAAKLADDLTRR